MLKINNLRKVFQPDTPSAHIGLSGVSLHLAAGEFATVIGSNGAGKSTLFNAIAGSFLVSGGSIRLDGQDITYQKEHVRAKNIGRLFQDPKTGTAPNLSIEENMALVYSKATERFPLRIALRAADITHFKEVLSKLDMGLEDRLKIKVGLLSGGQRQALALLIATLIPPKLLLLDEHTAALDPVTAGKVTRLTAEIATRHNITTLMITHNIGSALKEGGRTIMMDEGKIVLDLAGRERTDMTPQDLLRRYREITNREMDNDRMLLSGAKE
ncbi:MAG: ATP-binding cassette domain-containing protein [Gracilibacteraceae bacterium]|jgi:putative ABC transport system ATP-binding protein|nr:ATP-binding cassette domain-containing protein [Gracilibacteraceae bacterium]